MLALAGQTGLLPGRSMFDPRSANDEGVVTEVARREFVPTDWPSARGWQRAVVTSRWHFVLSESGERALYDLAADPHEDHNLAAAPEYAAIAERFSASLAAR
jgi:hypothetical protein